MPIYEPLQTSNHEIRLLDIVSVEPEIVCQLSTISLDQVSTSPGLTFCAVSYVWGDPNDTIAITVNVTPYQITRKLADALKGARIHWQTEFPDHDVTACRLWADALCINQNDIEEKNHQVPLMKRIYSNAEITFCCLDLAASEDDMFPAFDMLTTISQHMDENSLKWMENYPELFKVALSTCQLRYACYAAGYL